jgi:hypothetical protein
LLLRFLFSYCRGKQFHYPLHGEETRFGPKVAARPVRIPACCCCCGGAAARSAELLPCAISGPVPAHSGWQPEGQVPAPCCRLCGASAAAHAQWQPEPGDKPRLRWLWHPARPPESAGGEAGTLEAGLPALPAWPPALKRPRAAQGLTRTSPVVALSR